MKTPGSHGGLLDLAGAPRVLRPAPSGAPKESVETTSERTLKQLKAGVAGGVFGTITTHPLDTMRVVSQKHGGKGGLLEAWRELRRQKVNPYAGLWAGVVPACMGSAVLHAALFAINKNVDFWLEDSFNLGTGGGKYSIYERTFVAGSITGLLMGPLSSPMELIKCQMQTNTLHLTKNGGLRAWTRGYAATTVRCGYTNGFWFSFLEFSRQYRGRTGLPDENADPVGDAVTGAVSGTLWWVLAMPFDVIKVRQQTQEKYTSMFTEGKAVIRESGVKGLWRGLSIALWRTVPGQAAVYVAYQHAMTWV
jgi:hypothetical protein